MHVSPAPVGELLKSWRQRRCLSQLDLAERAEISQRHLSFLESGRASPSREMVLRLTRHLAVPSRARNEFLVAAGFAPVFRERALSDPELAAVQAAMVAILRAHEPFPALAVDRKWQLVAANRALEVLLSGVHPKLLEPPINVLKVGLHPEGLAPRVLNYAEWREHLLSRLTAQFDASGDLALKDLHAELKAYAAPVPPTLPPGVKARPTTQSWAGIAVPLELVVDGAVLRFLSTTTVFGTPIDIMLSELAIESFLPADESTQDFLAHAAKLRAEPR